MTNQIKPMVITAPPSPEPLTQGVYTNIEFFGDSFVVAAKDKATLIQICQSIALDRVDLTDAEFKTLDLSGVAS